MLGKLLKYEIKATYKIFLILSGIMILLAGINRLFMEMGFFQRAGLNVLSGVVSILYILMIFATSIVIFVLIAQRYYKNLFKDEGYLSLTLPVKASTHVLAKCIVAFIWNAISYLSAIISFFIIIVNEDTIKMINQLFIELRESNEYLGNQVGLLIFEFVISLILSFTVSALMIYFSISVGQLFNKNRIGMAFVTYFIAYIIQLIVTLISLSKAGFSLEGSSLEPLKSLEHFAQVMLPVLILVALVFGVLYFLGSAYILKRRLNLQ